MFVLKFLVLVLLALFFSTHCIGQSTFTEFSLGKERLGSFDAIVSGDSLFFSYEEKTVNGPVMHARWISKGHISKDIDIALPVAFIHPKGDELYLYSLEQSKSVTILHARSGKTNQTLAPLALSEGIVLGMYSDQNLFVVIYQRDENTIRIHEVDGDREVSKKKYTVPEVLRIWIRKSSNVEFIEHNDGHINTFKGYSRVKLIRQNDLYLILDNHMRNESLVITLRADGTSDQSTFPANSTDDFGTFIHNNKLFATIMSNKKLIINIHDLQSKKLIASKTIEKGSEEFDVYFRSAKYRDVSRGSLKSLMNVVGMGDPQLTVSNDSGNYLISWGSFIDDKGVGAPGGASPIGMLVGLAVTTTIKQMSEGPGFSRQFFYGFDEKTLQFYRPLDLSSNPRVKLDEFEIQQQVQDVKVKSKYYLSYDKGLMAIYVLPKEDVVRMVVFE